MAKTYTDQNFDSEVIKSTVPVLVDFWAPWCGPCRMQGPVVDDVALELEGKPVSIGKMNTDENPATPGQFGIQSIPTLLIFKDGKVVDQMVGVQDKNTLLTKLAAVMS